MKKTTARRLGIVAALVILIGAFAVSRFLSEMKEPPRRKDGAKKRVEVSTMAIQNGEIPTRLQLQGELMAYDKIDLFAEVSGVLRETSKPFKVGSYFRKDDVLARIDAEEARLSLLSQKSSLLNAIAQLMPDLKIDYPESYEHWNAYLDSFEVDRPIRPFPEPLTEQEKLFIATRNLYSQYYNIMSAEERLSKYVIEAPFSGVLTAANIHPGALVRVGQQLGTLMSTGLFELEATVALSELKYIKPGNPVQLTSRDIGGEWQGRVVRINDRVDPDMQTVKVFVNVRGADLKEGMYLSGTVAASSIEQAVRIPRNLLVDQKGVFEVVQDSILRLREVQVVKITKDAAIVRGLDDGATIIKEMLPNAYDGMKVRVKKPSDAVTEQSRPLSVSDSEG